MKQFDERWAHATACAAKAAEAGVPDIPLGFATRTISLARSEMAENGSWLRLLELISRCGLAGIGLAVGIAGVVHLSDFLQIPNIVPAIENTVVERFPLI